MQQSYDVVIVGGAVMGSSVAYHLAAEPAFDGRVLVVERDPSYAECSTTLSWGGIRQQFTVPESIRMSLFGAQFVKSIGEHLSVDGEVPDIGFREEGYLYLVAEDKLETLRAAQEIQHAHGARLALMGPDELAESFPDLNLDGVAAGSFGLENEGWVDPAALSDAFRRKARSLGVEYVDDEVIDIERVGDRVRGVRLAKGGAVATGLVVNAAGMHGAKVAAMAGLELPVGPHKVHTYVFDCRQEVRHRPLTIDVSGLVFRPEGTGFISIYQEGPSQATRVFDFELDHERFETLMWPILAHRVPAFEAIKVRRGWAGHYDYNFFDHNAILGPHPEVAGIMFINGFSGHGLQQSPAAGRGLAELIVFGAYQSLDLSLFAYDRLIRGEPIPEAYII